MARLQNISLLPLLLVLVGGFSIAEAFNTPSSEELVEEFASRLANEGVEVTGRQVFEETTDKPVLAHVVLGNEEQVQVFVFPDAERRERVAAFLQEEEMDGEHLLREEEPLTIYQEDRLLAFYIGETPAVLHALSAVLGKPMTGTPARYSPAVKSDPTFEI